MLSNSVSKILEVFFQTYSDIPLIHLDNDHTITYCNPAFTKRLKLQDSLCGTSIHDVIDVDLDLSDPLYISEPEGIISDMIIGTYTHGDTKKTIKGHLFFHEDIYVIIFDLFERHSLDIVEKMSQINVEMSSLTRDYSKKNIALDKKNQQMKKDVYTDLLTKLWNRRYLSESLIKLLQEKDPMGNPVNFGLIMFDIDDFKYCNDTYGHDTGDEVLKRFSRLVKRLIRRNDIAARYGGEEFVIVLLNIEQEQVLSIAEKIRRAFASVQFDGISYPITASFGISVRKKRDTISSLLKQADDALYKAKNKGKNCVDSL